eukprot:GFUD01035176.1.p1 GENE.GFUD01035176.1~~GFUD01035176.1.p1  ORF type:complete len:328 (+),score=47.83 GFUD01035176.1:64-1047(+)
MDVLPYPLSGVYYFWSLLLLPTSLVLNIAAFLLILRSAGSCYKDPVVPPLLSLLGSNLLHGVLVQIFLVHQQSSGSFVFTETLCGVIQVNQAVLQDVPFSTISLHLMVSLRRLKKKRDAYTYFHICCGEFFVIIIPWILAIVTNIVIRPHSPTEQFSDLCPTFYPPSLWQYIIRISIVMGIPFLLVLLVFLTTLPYLSTCMGPVTCRTNPISHNIKQDLTILSVLFLAHIIFQVPTKITECFTQYKHLQVDIFNLIVNISNDLPLIINPLGVLLIRGLGRRVTGKVESCQKNISVYNSPSEENIKMIVSMEGKELENALFKAKTTSL